MSELKDLQAKRKRHENTAEELRKAFCTALLDNGINGEIYTSIVNIILEYGQQIRKSEWANEQITRHLLNQNQGRIDNAILKALDA